MPSLMKTAIGQTTKRVPVLKNIPVLRLLALGEIALIAREHITKLEPGERRRLVELVKIGRGRPSKLSARERRELDSLIAKTEPRQFAGAAVDKLSPVSLPDRLLYGSAGAKARKSLKK